MKCGMWTVTTSWCHMVSTSMVALMGKYMLCPVRCRLLSGYTMTLYRFSRRVLWLRIGVTNKDPKIIAGHFLDTVQRIEGLIIYHD